MALETQGASKIRKEDHLRVLRKLDAFLGLKSVCHADGSDLAAYLAHRRECEGIAANSARKERQLALAFFAWAHETGQIGAETLEALRKTAKPNGSTAKVDPKPYAPKEIRELGEVLDLRWPHLDDREAERRVQRWIRGTGRYSRIRKHAIRLQLDAVIALGLYCGLRRGEIQALNLDDLHFDNAFVVVWRGERWAGPYREVPFTGAARAKVAVWLELRAAMHVDHEYPWLNLWSEKTARKPITHDTFAKLLSGHVGPKWNFRRLRHTCAAKWLKAGMTPVEVQQYLGYAELKELAPYLAAASAPLERRVERLQAPFARALTLA